MYPGSDREICFENHKLSNVSDKLSPGGTMKTADELVELTPAQLKAWKNLQTAVKEFVSAGGQFYSNLDILSGYNGKYVAKIEPGCTGECQADDCGMPSITNSGFCSYADDDAGLFFTPAGKKLLSKGADDEN